MSTFFDKYVGRGFSDLHRVFSWRITSFRGPGDVNTRAMPLWRPDNRYPGNMMVRRHESGGVELSFDALRHGAQPRKPIIVPADQVDRLILSLLEVRPPQPNDDTLSERDDLPSPFA